MLLSLLTLAAWRGRSCSDPERRPQVSRKQKVTTALDENKDVNKEFIQNGPQAHICMLHILHASRHKSGHQIMDTSKLYSDALIKTDE